MQIRPLRLSKRRCRILNYYSDNNILCSISVIWETREVSSKAITKMETTYPRQRDYTLIVADSIYSESLQLFNCLHVLI